MNQSTSIQDVEYTEHGQLVYWASTNTRYHLGLACGENCYKTEDVKEGIPWKAAVMGRVK